VSVKIVETNLKFKSELKLRRVFSYFMVHHVGPLGNMYVNKINAAMVHKWHLKRGWYGCGYHYVILTDGTIERGRHHKYIGSHCEGSNFETIGILIVQDCENGLPTPEQIDSLQRLLAELARIYRKLNLIGHKDRNDKSACPGFLLYNALPGIAGEVRKLLIAGA